MTPHQLLRPGWDQDNQGGGRGGKRGGGGKDSLTDLARPCIRGAGAGASDCKGVEAPWTLVLTKMDTQRRNDSEDEGKRRSTRGGRRDKRDMEVPAEGEPPGAERDLGAGQGRERGGEWTRDMVADAGTR